MRKYEWEDGDVEFESEPDGPKTKGEFDEGAHPRVPAGSEGGGEFAGGGGGGKWGADPATLTTTEVNRNLDHAEKRRTAAYDKMTADAPGHEKLSETKRRLGPDHPLVVDFDAAEDRFQALRGEIRARTGNDYNRMPHGFKPRKARQKTGGEHSYASTHLALEGADRERILALSAKIRDGDLAEDGREGDPHITIKYGLEWDDLTLAEAMFALSSPIEVEFGQTAVFPAREGADYDVVYVEVQSRALAALNKFVSGVGPAVDTQPGRDYRPHLTLAYVHPGEGEKYAGMDDVEGERVRFDSAVFSDRLSRPHVFGLGRAKGLEVKGDVEGHPFRGNQYGAGESGGAGQTAMGVIGQAGGVIASNLNGRSPYDTEHRHELPAADVERTDQRFNYDSGVIRWLATPTLDNYMAALDYFENQGWKVRRQESQVTGSAFDPKLLKGSGWTIKGFDEDVHPRTPSGGPGGGQFTAGEGGQGADDERGPRGEGPANDAAYYRAKADEARPKADEARAKATELLGKVRDANDAKGQYRDDRVAGIIDAAETKEDDYGNTLYKIGDEWLEHYEVDTAASQTLPGDEEYQQLVEAWSDAADDAEEASNQAEILEADAEHYETLADDFDRAAARLAAGPQDISKIEQRLSSSDVSDVNELGGGVSETFKITLSDGSQAVFKPEQKDTAEGMREHIEIGQQTMREVGAWEVAKLGGVEDLVAPTVEREVQGRNGAVLEWQEGDSGDESSDPYDGRDDLLRAALFDHVIGNQDRHPGNWLVDDGKLRLIDHGLSFPEITDHLPEGNTRFEDEAERLARKTTPAGEKWRPTLNELWANYADPYIKNEDQIVERLKMLGLPHKAIESVQARIRGLRSERP